MKPVRKKLTDLTERELVSDILAVQFVQGKSAATAQEYVALYNKARTDIYEALKASEPKFDVTPLTT